jgi:hypothetical protein
MNTTHSHLLAGLFAAAFAGTVQAATITWGSSVNILNDPTQISTNGTVHATAIGSRTGGAGVTGASVTVNGVQFFDNLTIDAAFVSHNDVIGGRTGLPNTAGDDYYDLLEAGDRDSSSIDVPITFTGLTIGTPYEIQFWASDNANPVGDSAVVLNNGNGSSPNPATAGHATVLYEATDGGPGQFVIGTFTADATSQELLVRRWTNLTTTPTASNQNLIQAWQIRAIPEPSTALLGALGALALLRRRR